MRIALDYDGTYTADPAFWGAVKALAEERGHEMFFVTKRGESNKGFLDVAGWQAHHADRIAKMRFCREEGIRVDIWIDDDPINIFEDR